MSLQAILEAIYAAGEAEVCKIETQAQKEIEEILAQAEAEAQRLHKEGRSVVLARAAQERARIIYRARLKAMKIVGDVRQALVDAALEQTRERLAHIRADPIYPAVLRYLIQEALVALEGSLDAAGGASLEADPRDRSLLESILPDLDLVVSVSYERTSWGGVVVKSQDGRIVVVNTLEARLERATPYLRRLMDALFQEEQRIGSPEAQ